LNLLNKFKDSSISEDLLIAAFGLERIGPQVPQEHRDSCACGAVRDRRGAVNTGKSALEDIDLILIEAANGFVILIEFCNVAVDNGVCNLEERNEAVTRPPCSPVSS
jgi:hypothetical protein